MKACSRVSADVLLRSLAILLVTFHHAVGSVALATAWFGGGTTVLMMLSGMNFAKFGMQQADSKHTSGRLLRFAGKLALASIAVVLLMTVPMLHSHTFAVVQNFVVFAFVHLHLWYAQVLALMCIGLAILFALPRGGHAFFKSPLIGSLALLVIALAIRAVCPLIWDTSAIFHRLPHLFLWNFILGWALFFLIDKEATPRPAAWRYGAVLLVLVASGMIGWGVQTSDFWCLLAAGVFWLACDGVRLPVLPARFVNITAQAALVIYLVHWVFLLQLARLFGLAPVPIEQFRLTILTVVAVLVMWVVPMLMSIACWVAMASTSRAYSTLKSRGIGAPQWAVKAKT